LDGQNYRESGKLGEAYSRFPQLFCENCLKNASRGQFKIIPVIFANIRLPLGAEIPLMVESFGLLNDIFPFPSILDAGYPVLIFICQISCLISSFHLYLGLPCDLLLRGIRPHLLLINITGRTFN